MNFVSPCGQQKWRSFHKRYRKRQIKRHRCNMAYIIAMSNEKGGVAKTTSTLSLGAALAELEHRVLLIDLDPQSNLSLAMGFEAGEAEVTSASVLVDNASIKTAIRKTDVKNLDIV